MEVLQPTFWPLWLTAAVTALAAALNLFRDARIPNWLTFPFILSGLALGVLHTVGIPTDAGVGGIEAALLGTVWGLVLCLPAYIPHVVGAGSVKLQMGVSAWIGAFYGVSVGASLVFWTI